MTSASPIGLASVAETEFGVMYDGPAPDDRLMLVRDLAPGERRDQLSQSTVQQDRPRLGQPADDLVRSPRSAQASRAAARFRCRR